MKEELVAPRPAWLTTPTLVPRPCWISVAELLWAKAAPERVRVAMAARRVRANMGRSPGVGALRRPVVGSDVPVLPTPAPSFCDRGHAGRRLVQNPKCHGRCPGARGL